MNGKFKANLKFLAILRGLKFVSVLGVIRTLFSRDSRNSKAAIDYATSTNIFCEKFCKHERLLTHDMCGVERNVDRIVSVLSHVSHNRTFLCNAVILSREFYFLIIGM